MSKLVHNQSHKMNASTEKSPSTKNSRQSTNTSLDNEVIINSITGYENDLSDRLQKLERDAEIQARQIELNECLEFVAQLVDLFKRTVVMSELQNQDDRHNDIGNQLPKNKSITGNRLLDDKVDKIALSKGLTKEQWSCLHYMALSTGDNTEITKTSKKHLQKIHDMVSRLLEDDEQNAVFALINAIEKHMSKKYFTEK